MSTDRTAVIIFWSLLALLALGATADGVADGLDSNVDVDH